MQGGINVIYEYSLKKLKDRSRVQLASVRPVMVPSNTKVEII